MNFGHRKRLGREDQDPEILIVESDALVQDHKEGMEATEGGPNQAVVPLRDLPCPTGNAISELA